MDTKDKMSSHDTVKWLAAFMLLAAGVYTNHLYEQHPLALRLIGWLILLLVVGALLLKTTKGRRFVSFAKDAQIELRKVVWPSRQETVQTAAIVIVMVVVMGFVLWGIDSILLRIVGMLTGQRG